MDKREHVAKSDKTHVLHKIYYYDNCGREMSIMQKETDYFKNIDELDVCKTLCYNIHFDC